MIHPQGTAVGAYGDSHQWIPEQLDPRPDRLQAHFPIVRHLGGYIGRVVRGLDTVTQQNGLHFMLVRPENAYRRFHLSHDSYPVVRLLTEQGCADNEAQTTQAAFLESFQQGRLVPETVSALTIFQQAVRVTIANKAAADLRGQSGKPYNYIDRLVASDLVVDPQKRRVSRDYSPEELNQIYPVVSALTKEERAANYHKFTCEEVTVRKDQDFWPSLLFRHPFDPNRYFLFEHFLSAHRFHQRDIEAARDALLHLVHDPNNPTTLNNIAPQTVLTSIMALREPQHQRALFNTIEYPDRHPQPGDIMELI